MENLISLFGFVVLIAFTWVLSWNRRKVNWRLVIGGVVLQFIVGALIFCLPCTRTAIVWLSQRFTDIINFSNKGPEFVFGGLASGKHSMGFILAFQVFPLIIVFSSLMAMLYYLRVIPFIIKMFARFLAKVLKTSGAESLCAASNVFVGVESVTSIRPYLATMTQSELFTILVVGMSTIASSVLAAYVKMLYGVFPAIAGHLISASILSVPAAFVISKVMIPETGQPETADASKCELHIEYNTGFTASLIQGANAGAKLAVGVAVTLIAFIGLLGILEGICGWFGYPGFIQDFLSWIFYPFAWLIGIAPQDVPEVSKLLGTRLVETEIPAYIDLAKIAQSHTISPRSMLIASYALCGFTHVASMAIFVGGIGALVPERVPLLAKLGPWALLAATLVTLMTGAVAGIFYYGQPGILQ